MIDYNSPAHHAAVRILCDAGSKHYVKNLPPADIARSMIACLSRLLVDGHGCTIEEIVDIVQTAQIDTPPAETITTGEKSMCTQSWFNWMFGLGCYADPALDSAQPYHTFDDFKRDCIAVAGLFGREGSEAIDDDGPTETEVENNIEMMWLMYKAECKLPDDPEWPRVKPVFRL